MDKMPLVSVVMASFNTEGKMLMESVSSILKQDYNNIEFIIIDDCSDVPVCKMLSSLTDSRIKIIRNEHNLGLTKSLNIAFKQATGKYIARMDSDDISLTERISTQVQYMESHLGVAVCGSYAVYFSNEEQNLLRFDIPTTRKEQQIHLFFDNLNFIHPSTLIRKSFLEKYGIEYNETYPKAQDYQLWTQITKYGPLYTIKVPLLKYRVHENQISIKSSGQQVACRDAIRLEQLMVLYPDASEEEKKIHLDLCNKKVLSPDNICWVKTLIKHNNEKCLFDKKLFERILLERWFEICYHKYIREKNKRFKEQFFRNFSIGIFFRMIAFDIKKKVGK